MSEVGLQEILDDLLAQWENECVEFKEAKSDFKTSVIGKYFSALSNEANLRGRKNGWLVFGVSDKTHEIVGTSYRRNPEQLRSLKKQIADMTNSGSTFREIHELDTAAGRVVLFEIPPAPRGIPISCNGHYFARTHESLEAMSIAKLDDIRSQSAADDWSAVICDDASINDLDDDAISRARRSFASLHAQRIPEATINGWDDATFLDKAKLTINGRITRAALILLGRNESTHHLNPYVAELTWKLEGPEQGYEHFHPPFLLETSRLYRRIRNVQLRMERPGELLPIEIPKYDQRIVLEALHNCIAHQDYTRRERILVIERPEELVFKNSGNFYDGSPNDYLIDNRTPTGYRNTFLAEAMFNLRMMDRMGYGIRDVIYRGQMARYLPLPDYDLSDSQHVTLNLPGRFIDGNYSRILLTHSDLGLTEALALDAVQKQRPVSDTMVKRLRQLGLVEGRRNRLHVARDIAASTDTVDEYLRHRGFDDRYYGDLILEFLRANGAARREDIDRLLKDKLSDLLDERQKRDKIRNLLQKLSRQKKIMADGKTKAAKWKLRDG